MREVNRSGQRSKDYFPPPCQLPGGFLRCLAMTFFRER